MTILNTILGYLLIGTVFTFCVDMINELLKRKNKQIPAMEYKAPTDEEWGITERVISIVLWPYAAIVFISAFFKSKNE